MDYITATEAAKIVGCTDKTIRQWIRQRKLTAHHASRNRLAIAIPDVEKMAREYQLFHKKAPGLEEKVSELEKRIEELEEMVRTALHKVPEELQDIAKMRELEAGPGAHSPIARRESIVERVSSEPVRLIHVRRPNDSAQEEILPPSAVPAPGSEPEIQAQSLFSREDFTPQQIHPAEQYPAGTLSATEFAKKYGIKPKRFYGHITEGFVLNGIRTVVPTTHRPKPSRPNEVERFLTPEQQLQAIAIWKLAHVDFNPPE